MPRFVPFVVCCLWRGTNRKAMLIHCFAIPRRRRSSICGRSKKQSKSWGSWAGFMRLIIKHILPVICSGHTITPHIFDKDGSQRVWKASCLYWCLGLMFPFSWHFVIFLCTSCFLESWLTKCFHPLRTNAWLTWWIYCSAVRSLPRTNFTRLVLNMARFKSPPMGWYISHLNRSQNRLFLRTCRHAQTTIVDSMLKALIQIFSK